MLCSTQGHLRASHQLCPPKALRLWKIYFTFAAWLSTIKVTKGPNKDNISSETF